MDSNNMNNQQPYQQQPYQQQTYQQPYQQQPVYNNFYQAPQVSNEYKPISMWGYLGYELLFCIPIVGFILIIILSFAPANKNVKNFARSYLLIIAIAVVVSIIMGFAGVSFFRSFL